MTVLIVCLVPRVSPQTLCVARRGEFKDGLSAVMERRALEVVCLTWNVGEGKPEPSRSNFFRWLSKRAASAAIVVVGLQEIEMGGGSVALAAARDRFAKVAQVWWRQRCALLIPSDVQC